MLNSTNKTGQRLLPLINFFQTMNKCVKLECDVIQRNCFEFRIVDAVFK